MKATVIPLYRCLHRSERILNTWCSNCEEFPLYNLLDSRLFDSLVLFVCNNSLSEERKELVGSYSIDVGKRQIWQRLCFFIDSKQQIWHQNPSATCNSHGGEWMKSPMEGNGRKLPRRGIAQSPTKGEKFNVLRRDW